MKLLEQFISLFSLGGDKKKQKKERVFNRYLSNILLREPFNNIFEYHYLFLDANGEPAKISIQRYYKDFMFNSGKRLGSEVSEKTYSLDEYMKLFSLSLNEVKALFSSRRDLYSYRYSYVKNKAELIYTHEFDGINVKINYFFDMSKIGLERVLVKEIKRAS